MKSSIAVCVAAGLAAALLGGVGWAVGTPYKPEKCEMPSPAAHHD